MSHPNPTNHYWYLVSEQTKPKGLDDTSPPITEWTRDGPAYSERLGNPASLLIVTVFLLPPFSSCSPR